MSAETDFAPADPRDAQPSHLRTRRNLFWSMADAGTSSVASFAAGMLALKILEPTAFGLYALLFSAGVAGMVLPQQMGYLPRRLHINRLTSVARSRYREDLARTIPLSLLAAVVVAACGFPLYGAASNSSTLALVGTAVTWVIVSPFQDHVRTSLHTTGRHSWAAIVSGCQLLVIGLAIGVSSGIHPQGWAASLLPFGVLSIANILSATVGVLLHLSTRVSDEPIRMRRGQGIRTATSAIVIQVTAYATNAIVASTAGAEALATLEAARIVAQPVLIIGTGLSLFFIPQFIRLRKPKPRDARRAARQFSALLAIGSTAYVVASPAVGAIVGVLTGKTIDVSLSVARAVSFTAQSFVGPLNTANIADSNYRRAIAATLTSSALSVISLLALIPRIGLLAVPTSVIIGTVPVYIVVGWRLLRELRGKHLDARSPLEPS